MTLKKSIALLTSLIMGICCFAGCSDSSDKGGKDVKIMEMRDVTAKELVSEMKIGWNLGNTLDADDAEGVAAETSWGNPKTREDMFTLLKDTGFNVVRIPVTWNGHMDDQYKVDSEWMARVKEIVDYGIKNDMYVILNTHHEEWYYPTSENKDEDIKQLKALWEQIAEEFKGYDEHLLFEGLNEPRLRDTSMEWTGGTPEAQQIINEYEQTFYDTVRNSGGNNDKRCLLLTGYCASSQSSSLQAINLPKDDKNVIISVHAYLPYSFALDVNGTDKFDVNNDAVSIDSLFLNLDNFFLCQDVPVIITECGCLNKNNLQDRIECMKYYLTTAKSFGVPCVLWDNGSFVGKGETFGLMDRQPPAEWKTKELIDAMIECVK